MGQIYGQNFEHIGHIFLHLEQMFGHLRHIFWYLGQMLKLIILNWKCSGYLSNEWCEIEQWTNVMGYV